MDFKIVKIDTLKLHRNNPRSIKTDKYIKLKESIQKFPEMLNLRPLVINENNEVLGGNMRLLACKELGYLEIPIIEAFGLTLEQQKEFIIKDNISFGEWDFDILANTWESEHLVDWGMDLPTYDNAYIPIYDPIINTDDITQQQIETKAKELAEQMVKSQKTQEVMCPTCGYEFKVS